MITAFESANTSYPAAFFMKTAIFVGIQIGLLGQTMFFDFFRNGRWILRKKSRNFFEGKTLGECGLDIFTIDLA